MLRDTRKYMYSFFKKSAKIKHEEDMFQRK